jgi:hypothetical protein
MAPMVPDETTASHIITCDDIRGLNNREGTCWNNVIQTMLFYGSPDIEETQHKLFYSDPFDLVMTAEGKLSQFLPSRLTIRDDDKLTVDAIEYLIQIVTIVQDRYKIKVNELYEICPHAQDVASSSQDSLVASSLRRSFSNSREIDLTTTFFKLIYGNTRKNFGGNINDTFILFNLLNIIFKDKFYEFNYHRNFTDNLVIDVTPILIPIENILAVEMTCINMSGNGHSVGFFKCSDKEKFCSNEIIIDYNWTDFFRTYNEKLGTIINVMLDLKKGPFIIVEKDKEFFSAYYFSGEVNNQDNNIYLKYPKLVKNNFVIFMFSLIKKTTDRILESFRISPTDM